MTVITMGEKKTETEILDDLRDRGIAESAEEIPFEKCNCYFCSQETLRFEETH
ncbi:hypothetical protein [Saliphagus sp. LR7]|uniref:hypothetical protein n=1 Tax=Saliphagus sp. LR7 TaxID=2282654 RepID=UPI001300433C|nr:hypothetical protein [Saliphagus sp. LR7]